MYTPLFLRTVYGMLHLVIMAAFTPTHKIKNTNVDVKAVRERTIHRCTGNQFQLGSILIFTSAQRLQTTAGYLIAQ